MIQNKKTQYIILILLLLIFGTAWILKQDKPVEASAEQVHTDVAQSTEVAPVQPELEYYPETPEEYAEEDYWNSVEMIAICVEAEAGNQGLEGKRLVVDVILNRVDDDSGEWPDTIQEVIGQLNQFSSYWDGGMERVIEPSEETFEAVRMELEERSYPGIYYFREGTWSEYGTPWRQVGDHYFSTK